MWGPLKRLRGHMHSRFNLVYSIIHEQLSFFIESRLSSNIFWLSDTGAIFIILKHIFSVMLSELQLPCELNNLCDWTTAESRAKILSVNYIVYASPLHVVCGGCLFSGDDKVVVFVMSWMFLLPFCVVLWSFCVRSGFCDYKNLSWVWR